MRDFIDRNIDSPLDLLSVNLARLVAIGGFRRLAPKVEQYLRDPRTQRLYSFQAMYAGVSPYDALALYAVIAYMDSVAGVYFPAGGMAARAGGDGGGRGEARRRDPLLHDRDAGRASAAPGPWPCTRRTASGSRPTSSCSTPTCPWPIATCSAWSRDGCGG